MNRFILVHAVSSVFASSFAICLIINNLIFVYYSYNAESEKEKNNHNNNWCLCANCQHALHAHTTFGVYSMGDSVSREKYIYWDKRELYNSHFFLQSHPT